MYRRPSLRAARSLPWSGGHHEQIVSRRDEIGYRRPGETEQQVWKRALADVYAYWRPKLDEDDWENWPTHVK